MSDAFGISLSALQAFQQAIAVTSNNVANANTPGYDEETIQLTDIPPHSYGGLAVGGGVGVVGVNRAYSQAEANQLEQFAEQFGFAQCDTELHQSDR